MIGNQRIVSFYMHHDDFHVVINLDYGQIHQYNRFRNYTGPPVTCTVCEKPGTHRAFQKCLNSKLEPMYACSGCMLTVNAMFDRIRRPRPVFARLNNLQVVDSTLRGKSFWVLAVNMALIAAIQLPRELQNEIGKFFGKIVIGENMICANDLIDLNNFIKTTRGYCI